MGLTLIVLSLVAARAVHAETYVNEEFGMRATFSASFAYCSNALFGRHDHGVDIYLDRALEDCTSDDVPPRRIEVFALYNAIDVSGLKGLLHWACELDTNERPVRRCRSAPSGLSIGGLRSIAGRGDRPGGVVQIVVVAQGGRGHNPNAPAPLVDYTVTLFTTQAHLREDVRRLRGFLSAFEVSPPH
jgi:hypothetical protein